jgi:GTP-binding protein HflX
LEEARYADIILHVVDASNPRAESRIHTVYRTLSELGVEEKPLITLFNKQDMVKEPIVIKDLKADYSVKTSLKTGEGISEVLEIIEGILRGGKVFFEEVLPFNEAGKIQLIRKYGELLKEEYRQDGIYVEGYVPQEILGKIKKS